MDTYPRRLGNLQRIVSTAELLKAVYGLDSSPKIFG